MVSKALDMLIVLFSGQQPENPLLLLEQYSDDELDEESSKSLNNAIVENFLADLDDQVFFSLLSLTA